MLQNNSTLKSLIDKLWQNFWEGGIANPLNKGRAKTTNNLQATPQLWRNGKDISP